MSALTYLINTTSLEDASLANIQTHFDLLAIKVLFISATDALISPNIIDPENAYS